MRIFLIIAIFLVLGAYACADTSKVSVRLGTDGEILTWLILGPFQNPGVPHKSCRGFDFDHLFAHGTEAKAKPTEGERVASTDRILEWRLVTANVFNNLNFVELFDWREPGVAYAYAEIISPSAKDARLLLGSDDGVKVWLNGELVHENHVTRGVTRDNDRVRLQLNQGSNQLMFKVDQSVGGWGLTARIVDMDGAPASDLTGVLDVNKKSNPENTSVVSTVRSMAGKSGSLDVKLLLAFEGIKSRSALWMPWFMENNDKGEHLRKEIANQQRKVNVERRKNADTLSTVLADAVLAVEKSFDSGWEDLKTTMQNPKPLIETEVSKEDYIQVAPGGGFFTHSDGKTFFTPLGYNHNPDWPGTLHAALGHLSYDFEAADNFMRYISESGVNVLRIMVESPAGPFRIEEPIGTFNPEQVAFLDNIVKLARKYDIRLWVTPWDTFWMSHRWANNPYNAEIGGPVKEKIDFITKREVIELQKNRIKYLIDRWGNLDTIFAWELLNEADYWWDATPEQVIEWTREMYEFTYEYEKERWGRNRMICVSTGFPIPEGGWGDLAYRMEGMDFATTHLYLGVANEPDEAIGPAKEIRRGVEFALEQIRDNRPYIDGENGPINRWIADQDFDNEVFHHMSWAHIASGGAGSSFRWPYRHPHHLSDGMYAVLSIMSDFADNVPWAKLIGDRSEMEISEPEGWVACKIGTSKAALAWIASPEPTDIEISVSWSDAPETVRYRGFDTRTGEWIERGTVKSNNGEFSISIEGKRDSVAFILE